MTALLNPRLWFYLAIACALGLAGAFLYRAGKANVRADFDAYKIAQRDERILADRAREHRTAARQELINKEARDGQSKIAALESERDASRADGERLRAAIRAATQRTRTLSGTPGAGTGEPGADPVGMFADMLERFDRRAEAVSVYADRLRIAGAVCERGWDGGLSAATR